MGSGLLPRDCWSTNKAKYGGDLINVLEVVNEITEFGSFRDGSCGSAEQEYLRRRVRDADACQCLVYIGGGAKERVEDNQWSRGLRDHTLKVVQIGEPERAVGRCQSRCDRSKPEIFVGVIVGKRISISQIDQDDVGVASHLSARPTRPKRSPGGDRE
mgnify:CR=1 FL=1